MNVAFCILPGARPDRIRRRPAGGIFRPKPSSCPSPPGTPALQHSNTPPSHSPPAANPPFPPNYFHFCKSTFLAAKPLLPGLYKAFFEVINPVFGPAFCTHGGQSLFQIRALIVP